MSVVLCLPAHLCVSPQRPVAGPPRERVTAAHHTTGGTPEQRSTAPPDGIQPRATTEDQATATGASSTEQEPGPTHARHAPPGKTQSTPQHRNTTGNNTHRTGTTRDHPTTQHKSTPAPAGAQRAQQHTPAHPTTQDTQTGPSIAQPAHQGRKKKQAGAQKKRGNVEETGAPENKRGGGREAEKKKEKGRQGGNHRAPRPKAPRAGNHKTPETRRRQKKKAKKTGAGGRTTRRQGPRHPGPENKERQRQGGRNKEKEKETPNNNHKQGNPSPEGAEQTTSAPRPATEEGEAHQNAPGRPARPTQPRGARTRTPTGDPGVAASDPKEAVSASTRNSPAAPTESPVRRRTVRETGCVSDLVHARKPPQRTQPKTDAGGTRQGQLHRGARNRYDAERAQRPCLSGGQRRAQ